LSDRGWRFAITAFANLSISACQSHCQPGIATSGAPIPENIVAAIIFYFSLLSSFSSLCVGTAFALEILTW
jgi:hypothetical protein